MDLYIIEEIFGMLIWPIIIGGVIWFVISARRKKKEELGVLTGRHTRSPKEDGISQWFFLLFFFFLFLTILAVNNDWQLNLQAETMIVMTAIVGTAVSYFFSTIFVLFFSILGLVTWWGMKAIHWLTEIKPVANSGFYQGPNPMMMFVGLALIALILFSLGYSHRVWGKFKRFSMVYILMGLLPVTGMLFFLSNRLSINVFNTMTIGQNSFASVPLSFSLLIFLITLSALVVYNFIKKVISVSEMTVFFLVAILFISLLFINGNLLEITNGYNGLGIGYYGSGLGIGAYGYTSTLTPFGIFFISFFNLAIFFELLALILAGYHRHEIWMINLGAVLMSLLIFVKYFDWFFTFLDKSVFFIGAGILLLGVGWFMEKSRKRMVASVRGQSAPIAINKI